MKQQNKPTRTILRQWESCVIIFVASFGIEILVSFLINIPLGLAVGYTGSLLQDLISLIAVTISIFVLSYRDGCQNYQFELARLLLALLLTLATQVVLIFIFGQVVWSWFSGPTIYIARRVFNIYNPVSIPSKVVLETYRWVFMIAGYIFLYIPTMLLGEYLGAQKHKKEFGYYKESEKYE